MTIAGGAIHFTLGTALGAVLLAMTMFGVLAVKAPKGLKSNDFKLFHVYSKVLNKRELHFLLFFSFWSFSFLHGLFRNFKFINFLED